MEKHKCRFCFKFFPNGSALGGHMRSHMISLQTSSSSSSEEEIQSSSSSGVDKFANLFFYGQNSNESSEWSKDPNRRRSKRMRKKQIEEAEAAERQVSSISDARTNEEDLAFSLMMLSRDRWRPPLEIEIDEDEEGEEEEECEIIKRGTSDNNRTYKCGTCEKVFKSYQALGGHRASHKKEKLLHHVIDHRPPRPQVDKLHECPYCERVFSSGQALGGHKRSHFIGESANSIRCSKYLGTIDLNLPALG